MSTSILTSPLTWANSIGYIETLPIVPIIQSFSSFSTGSYNNSDYTASAWTPE